MGEPQNMQDMKPQLLREAGWHPDPAEPRRWRHPSLPALDPLTTEQAYQLVQANERRYEDAKHGEAGAPPRTH